MAEGAPVLEARALVKSYGHGKASVPVLKGLDLKVKAGELIAILGPSGSGKSTLLNLLGLMDAPDGGELLFSGRAAARLSDSERARLRNEKLGFVFQFDSLLPEFTVLENVTLPARIAASREGRRGVPAEASSRGLELLAGLGLKHLKDRFPYQVSGGERQRAALCRALVNGPQLILADEPTGNLDKHNGELVFKDLRSLAETRGVAVVMVTHNEQIRDYASRILHMQEGALTPNP